MKNKILQMLFASIIKQSKNDLPFSTREIIIMKWFIKLGLIVIIATSSWIIPGKFINNYIVENNRMANENKELKAIICTHEKSTTTVENKTVEKSKTTEKKTKGIIREVTMYTSTPEQTDSSPCIGANGQDVCKLWKNGQNICATNAYSNGTEINIEKLGSCLVTDKMNKRFTNRIDWYGGYDDDCLNGVHKGDNCENYNRAVKFGIQNLLVVKK